MNIKNTIKQIRCRLSREIRKVDDGWPNFLCKVEGEPISTITNEIGLINQIVVEAVWHGADCGGAYYNNEKNLAKALTDWLIYKSLDGEYEIRTVDVETFDRLILPDILQIVRRRR